MSEVEYMKKQIRERCHARKQLGENGEITSPIRTRTTRAPPITESKVEAKTSKGKKGKKKVVKKKDSLEEPKPVATAEKPSLEGK
jgi:hypothetical protein